VISESLEEVEHRERMEFQARKRKAQAQRAERRRKMAAEALERGRERLRAEQQDQALEAFEEAVKLDQGSADAWIRIAYVCELEGDMEKAAAAFREAKRLWAL
jgi:Tfp pilus assembly protein PilF